MEWCGSTGELREAAYEEGRQTFDALCAEPSFRDFVNLYIAEGYRRNRNCVSLANSDAAVIAVAATWMRRLSRNKLDCRLQYHADQDLDELRAYWGRALNVEPELIGVSAKSNSGQLGGRTWRSRYGVCTVRTNDTYLRARLQAWMDCLKGEWLHSGGRRGVAKPGYRAAFGAPRSAVRIRPPRSRRFESADLTKP